MPLLDNHRSPMKPAEYAEHQILEAILDNSYSPGDALPGERALAQSLGVTRPTIRETLQRLAKDGWVTISHGRPTRVNDYLTSGGLGILTTLARYGDYLSHEMIVHMLEVRALMLPGAARKAAQADPGVLLDLLAQAPGGKQAGAEAFARFDWELQIKMVALAGNPVLRMIFNDFAPVYRVLGERYFQAPACREASVSYYLALETALGDGPEWVKGVVETAMVRAGGLWEQLGKPGEGSNEF